MEAITKKEFKDYPDTSTPITSEWLNEFQDKIIANFTEIETKLAIIESGTNDKGSWIKYSDGTLIQCGKIDKTKFNVSEQYSQTVQNITFYRSDNPTIEFPISFINENAILTTSYCSKPQYTRAFFVRIGNIGVNAFEIQLIAFEPFYNNGKAYESFSYVTWQAIGRWK